MLSWIGHVTNIYGFISTCLSSSSVCSWKVFEIEDKAIDALSRGTNYRDISTFFLKKFFLQTCHNCER